jgi:putative hydrolase of the HAD superfamily
MKIAASTTCLFVDIGGVLLTNGWDHLARRRAAKHFGLQWDDTERRHHMAFEAHEEGRLTLEQYLTLVVFNDMRSFSRAEYRRFMFAQSGAIPDMLALVHRLKARYGLKIVAVSNEGRELNAYRIRKFRLAAFVDTFISSCFVHVRKPDPGIFRFALDIAQVDVTRVVYIENTPMFVRVGESVGIRSILHTDFRSTRAKLAAFGLKDDEGEGIETRGPRRGERP